MKEVRTGIYKRITIKLPEKELLIPLKNLESKIKDLNFTIKERENPKNFSKKSGLKQNIESLKRIVETANLLIEGYTIENITKKLELKYSTIESYISYLSS